MNNQFQPKIGVSVLLMKKSYILLGKRKNSHGTGTWGFPGGSLEFRETVTSCAIREVYEEVGIKINNLSFLGFTNDFFTQDNLHYVTFFMLARLAENDTIRVMEPDKCEEWSFYLKDNLPSPLFLPVKNFFNDNFCIKNFIDSIEY